MAEANGKQDQNPGLNSGSLDHMLPTPSLSPESFLDFQLQPSAKKVATAGS